MENQWLAPSILQPLVSATGATTDGTSAVRQKRPRDSYLYDRNGKRLKGLKGEAAKLMHSHRFFSTEEELHRLEQTLATEKRLTAPFAGGGSGGVGGAGAHKLPALPDMFGVLHPTATGTGTCEAASGEVPGHDMVIPPMHRWSLVQQRHVTMRPVSTNADGSDAFPLGALRVGTSGYRWARADALHVEDALASALSTGSEGGAEEESGDGRGALPGLRLADILSAPPEVEFSVLHSDAGVFPFGFFTLTAEEYATLGLDDDAYQPLLLSNEDDALDAVPWRFDFASTCKLLTLYERFGNFMVVADRWRYTNFDDVAVASAATSMETGDSKIPTSTTPQPSVELLMERYRLVSEVVLRHRLGLLQETLNNNSVMSETCSSPSSPRKVKDDTAAVKTKQAEERIVASSHPLTSLMEKHPILAARRRRQEWLMQKHQELRQSDAVGCAPDEADVELHERNLLVWNREEFLRRCAESTALSLLSESQQQERAIQAACKAPGNELEASLLASCPPPPPAPPFWYDGLLEQARRTRLREFLLRETRVNVPYLRAVVAFQRLDSQATLLFDKLRALTHDGTNSGPEERQANCCTEVVKTREKTDVGRKRRTFGKHNKQQQQQATEAVGEDSYQGVQEEVARVPLQCERLKLSVQAGWFLPTCSGGVGGKPTGGAAVANRAFSNFSEALLLTLPSTAPRLHLGVEHELEKHLWEDHQALSDDNAEVLQMISDVRVLYTQNVILRRFAGRCGTLEASLKKLVADAAAMEM